MRKSRRVKERRRRVLGLILLGLLTVATAAVVFMALQGPSSNLVLGR